MIILDDFDANNILNIINYTSGVEFVRNSIIFESSKNTFGFNYVYWDGSTTKFEVIISGTSYSTTGTMAQIHKYLSETTSIIQAGLTSYLVSDYESYDTAILLVSSGDTDFKEFNFQIYTQFEYNTNNALPAPIPYSIPLPSPPTVLDSKVEYNDSVIYFEWADSGLGTPGPYAGVHGATTSIMFTLAPYNDNQITRAEDSSSILQYGKKILPVPNYEYISSSIDKQTVLNNKLAELKDPKARCFVDIPFDYEQPSELDLVEVRLSYKNVDRFNSFKEGGHFKTWTDEGTYRYKQFYIVGISHSQDGQYTRLRLMEKV